VYEIRFVRADKTRTGDGRPSIREITPKRAAEMVGNGRVFDPRATSVIRSNDGRLLISTKFGKRNIPVENVAAPVPDE